MVTETATVVKLRDYPRTQVEEPKRPFRLWNTKERKRVPHRF